MAEIQAPYFSPEQLIGMPGDAALGGGTINFDPANKAPLQPLQDTFTRLDTENNAAIQAEKQRQFEAAQQKEREQHDLLTKKMEREQQMKVLQTQQAYKRQDQLFNTFNSMDTGSANMRDPQSGQDMSIPFHPDDAEQLTKEADSIRKGALAEPFKDYGSELNSFKRHRALASVKASYLAQDQVALQQAQDPQERQSIQDHMDYLNQYKLNSKDMIHPYVSPQLTFKPLVDYTKFKKDDMQEYEDGIGMPVAPYLALKGSNDRNVLNQGFARYNAFRQMPEGQDWNKYQAYQQELNKVEDQKGIPNTNLGGQPDGKGGVIFDDNGRTNQLEHARNFAYADELMHSGRNRPYSEDEQLATEKKKAEITKLTSGGKLSKEQMVENADQNYVQGKVNEVKKVFNSTKDPQSVPARVFTTLRGFGINPENYSVFPVQSKVADKYIGEQAQDAKGKILPKAIVPDEVYLMQDKNTGDKELIYLQQASKTDTRSKIIARVNERQALVNGIKDEHNYDDKQYSKKIDWVDILHGEPGTKGVAAAPTATPAVKTKVIKGVEYEMLPNGKWYKK